MNKKNKLSPKCIWAEYEAGQQYKNGIGDKGIHDQARINERFFIGDQWHGVSSGNEKPLTRRNIIKRIGEYKMATVGSAPIAVTYSAEGISDTSDINTDKMAVREQLLNGQVPQDMASDAEISVIMSALTDYFKITAERLKFDDKKDQMLRNAYISGSGILYTYWDSDISTGLYADTGRTRPIKGDVACDVIDIENVVFGDPNDEEIESQPYIIIAQRKDIDQVRRMAEKYEQNTEDIVSDGANGYYKNAGDRGMDEPNNSKRVTVITKFYKKYDKNGECTVWGKTVTQNAVIRPEWNLLIHRYPMAKFVWERRRSCAYGDSEITYQIPNQIALNQAHSISVWAMQNTGMPKTIVNGDLIPEGITNDPAEVVKIYGSAEDMVSAIRYVAPPNYGAAFINFTNAFAQNVLSDNGANDAALGNLRPDNATAIVQAREAAMAPMQMYQNRFYSVIEDIARIWADFWITMYGKRSIKINNNGKTQYMVFDAERYRELIITARVDVGASTLWSEAVSISNLSNLLQSQLITFVEYLERIPKGLIPNVGGLINSRKAQEEQSAAVSQAQPSVEEQPMPVLEQEAQPIEQYVSEEAVNVSTDDISDEELFEYLKQTNPQLYERLIQLSPEDRAKVLTIMRNQTSTASADGKMAQENVGEREGAF